MKKLGILGGMGPQATIRLYDSIIRQSIKMYGAKHNADFPHLFISNLPVRDLISSKKDEEVTVTMLCDEARRFEQAGADGFLIACNTIYLYADIIQQAVSIPLLSPVNAVVDICIQDKRSAIGFMGSQTTMQSSLYTGPLLAAGIQVHIPLIHDHSVIADSIQTVIAGDQSSVDRKRLTSIIDQLVAQGSEALLLGCTELPLLIGQSLSSVPLYSSLDILTSIACRFVYEE